MGRYLFMRTRNTSTRKHISLKKFRAPFESFPRTPNPSHPILKTLRRNVQIETNRKSRCCLCASARCKNGSLWSWRHRADLAASTRSHTLFSMGRGQRHITARIWAEPWKLCDKSQLSAAGGITRRLLQMQKNRSTHSDRILYAGVLQRSYRPNIIQIVKWGILYGY